MEIQAKERKVLGKKNKALRREGYIPAVIYGPDLKESISIKLDAENLKKVEDTFKHPQLVDLKVGGQTYKVIVRNISRDPVSEKVLHVDFMAPGKDRTIDINVPIKITGVSPAVKNNIGVLVRVVSTIPVRCKPENIPQYITIDISGLEVIGDNILLRDVKLQEEVSIIREKDQYITIVTIAKQQKKEEIQEVTEEAEAAEEGEETTEEATEQTDETKSEATNEA